MKVELPDGPIALSLSGGGSRGAFVVGLLKYLLTEKKFDYKKIRLVFGTSTGALIAAGLAAMIAQDNIEHLHSLVRLYETITEADILRANHSLAYRIGGPLGVVAACWAFGGTSIYSTEPLEKLADEYFTKEDWEAIAEAGKGPTPFEVGFCVVNLQTAQAEVITNRTHPDPTILRNAMLASASQPVFMPPKQIFKDVKHQYVDGCLLDFNPVEKLFTSGLYKEVEAILSLSVNNLSPRKAPSIGYDGTFLKEIGGVGVRTIKILVESVYDTDIKAAQLYNVLLKLRDVIGPDDWVKVVTDMPAYMRHFVTTHLDKKKYVPIHHIAPDGPIYMDSLKFEQPAMRDLVQRGFKEGSEIFG